MGDSNKVRRITLYSLILVGALINSVLAPFAGIYGSEHLGVDFNLVLYIIVCAASGISFIWTAVLLGFCNKPKSLHPLAQVNTHLYSLYVFAVVWGVLSIMQTVIVPHSCSKSEEVIVDPEGDLGDSGCGTSVGSALNSWLLLLLSVLNAFFTGRDPGATEQQFTVATKSESDSVPLL